MIQSKNKNYDTIIECINCVLCKRETNKNNPESNIFIINPLLKTPNNISLLYLYNNFVVFDIFHFYTSLLIRGIMYIGTYWKLF